MPPPKDPRNKALLRDYSDYSDYIYYIMNLWCALSLGLGGRHDFHPMGSQSGQTTIKITIIIIPKSEDFGWIPLLNYLLG